MMGGKQPHGFTIVETMLFLAVSGILLLSAIALISGKQSTAEFQQGMHQIQNDLQGEVAHVAEGYYSDSDNFTCTDGTPPGSGSLLIASGPASPEGTNLGCQYLGDAIQFGPVGAGNNDGQYIIYPVVGRQFTDRNETAPTSLVDAQPTAIAPSSTDTLIPDDSQTVTLPYGITVQPFIHTSAPGNTTATLGFFALNTSTSSGPNGGSLSLVGVGQTIGTSSNTKLFATDSIDNASAYGSSTSGYQVCFKSGSNNQVGIISFGSDQNPSSVTLLIEDNSGVCS